MKSIADNVWAECLIDRICEFTDAYAEAWVLAADRNEATAQFRKYLLHCVPMGVLQDAAFKRFQARIAG